MSSPTRTKRCLSLHIFCNNQTVKIEKKSNIVQRIIEQKKEQKKGKQNKTIFSNEHKFMFSYFVAENDKQSAHE